MDLFPPSRSYRFRSRRTECLSCGARRGWSGLVNEAEEFGYCHACGEKRFPNTGNKTSRTFDTRRWTAAKNGNLRVERNICFHFQPPKIIPFSVVESTLGNYGENSFARFLAPLLGERESMELLRRWQVGTGENGAAVFWHRDVAGNFRYGKQMVFDVKTGKKQFVSSFQHYHANNGFRPCLFGEDRLAHESGGAVVLVESEKNAILGDFWADSKGLRPAVWLATGGVNGLTTSKAAAIAPYLRHRKILTVFDADPAGRKGGEMVKNVLASYGLVSQPLDLFPDRSDGWDVGDAILETLKIGQIKPVDAPKSESGTNIPPEPKNTPQTIVEAKYAALQLALERVWPLCLCPTVAETTHYAAEMLAEMHGWQWKPPEMAALAAAVMAKFNANRNE